MTPEAQPHAVARREPSNGISAEAMEAVLVGGNLSAMRPADRVQYYQAVCESLGLNPLTQPFAYLNLNGKLVLYAKRDCTDQLRRINNISITIPAREVVEGCYIVTARAQTPQNRQDESLGAVPIDGLKGEARSNAMMKAETKAKRRVTLSICGLAFLDESELDSVHGAVPVTVDPQGQITSGTKECAQAVAESKISGKMPLLGAPEPVPATLEDQLHESISQSQDSRQRKPYDKFAMYKAIGGMKDRFEKIGQEAQYRAVLLRYGAHKRTELPEDDGGKVARKCYKEMSLLVGELEAADAIEREKAAAALAAIPEVDKLPDAIEQNRGTQMRSRGILWTVVESEDGYRWQPEIK
jgi:hypothetical protein